MIALLLLVAALVLFIVAAIAPPSRVNLTAAGLACLTASILFGGAHL